MIVLFSINFLYGLSERKANGIKKNNEKEEKNSLNFIGQMFGINTIWFNRHVELEDISFDERNWLDLITACFFC